MPSALPLVDPSVSLPEPLVSATAAPSSNARRASLKVLSRNIDQVVLGNLLFRTWYYSPYPDSIILGDSQISGSASTSFAGTNSATTSKQYAHANLDVNGVRDAREHSPVSAAGSTSTSRAPVVACERLHVCPYCFRYTPKSNAYVQHLRRHSVTYDPHTTTEVPDSTASPESPPSEKSEDTGGWPVPESAIKVYEHSGYAVWDVDGEQEKLYCQNLSLFGKLFLEQKSVFFDTGGFHYFVLTYTPPPKSQTTPTNASKTPPGRPGRRRASSHTKQPDHNNHAPSNSNPDPNPPPVPQDINLHTQVLGFFSKENLSWDANNLACILVFPPYQHRNLGQLLMAISYKLSGWEWENSIIGGPEKPLSAMGRKSYLRFWSERIARFMMGETADADGRRVFDSVRKRKKVGFSREEMTVKEVGERTGMLSEDVVAALNEMGVLEVVPPKKKKRKSGGEEEGVAEGEAVLCSMVVRRSRVLEWVGEKGVDLVSPVKEEGFLGEWALSEVEEGDEGGGSQESEQSE